MCQTNDKPVEMNKITNDLFANQFSIAHWNCAGGLMSKLVEIKSIIAGVSPEVIFISESEILNPTHLQACQIPDYIIHASHDHSSNQMKSRLICYTRSASVFKRRVELEGPDYLEVIVLDNLLEKERCIGVYNPFKIPSNMTKSSYNIALLECLSEAASTPLDVIIIGDFNIDLMNKNKHQHKEMISNWQLDNGLLQLVESTTRHRSVTTTHGTRIESSLIDHIYVNTQSFKPHQIYSDLSDHVFIIASRPSKITQKCTLKFRIRDWRNYDAAKLTKTINKYNLDFGPVKFEESLLMLLDRVAPFRIIRIKNLPDQLVHPKLEKKKKRRDRQLKLFRQTGNEEFLKETRKLSKEIKKMVKELTKKSIQDKSSSSPRAFWQTVNSLLGRKAHSGLTLVVNDQKITDASSLSDIFMDFFVGKVEQLSNLKNNPLRELSLQPTHKPLTFNTEDLLSVLKNVKTKKCHGTDGIPLLLARDVIGLHPESAVQIMNNVARFGMPEEWRIARVIPLHKKGSQNDVTNFRPISNLNAISKIYEKLLLTVLERETAGLEGPTQHGFRKCHSTVTALLELQSFIAKKLDDAKIVVVYSVDLSAAFDLLRNDVFDDIIGRKLSDGLRYSLLDFLSNRRLTVNIASSSSSAKRIEVGCVQGSTLGPRLFTLYMSGIAELLQADKYICYADDSYVLVSGDNLEEAKERIKDISKRHVSILVERGMKVNQDKTEVMVFTKKGQIVDNFDIAGSIVKSGTKLKALGVLFDNNLTWQTHVESNIKSSSWKLAVLRKIRNKFTFKQFTQILTSQFFSKLFYCSQVWLTSATKRKLWNSVNSIHYRAVRVAVHDHKRRINREKLDIKCARASPKQWSKYAISNTVIKVLRDGLPSELSATLHETLYEERRRPGFGKFYDNSKGKIGRQKFGNNIHFMTAIKEPWLGTGLQDASIRRILKSTFFSYFNAKN
jgi:hypothetical protein